MIGLPSKTTRRFVAATSLVFMLMAMFPAPISYAQSTSGTVVGVVFDDAGKPLPGAKITVVNDRNGNTRATVTDQNGTYRLPFLTPGAYTITATKDGYKDNSVATRVPLNDTTEIRPPAITLVSSNSTTPTPTPTPTPTIVLDGVEDESSSIINKSDAARGGNFTEKQIETLPLGGGSAMRTFDELATLLPGVAPPPYTPGVRGPGVGFGIGTAGQFSVNGSRARSNNFTIDGSDNNDPDVGVRRQGFVTLVPQSIESVQEFQISTLLWDAELGRNVGSQVNAVSKGGGNDFHGQLYGFFTDSRLNARNAFDYTGGPSGDQDPFTRTQSGFVIGGPIQRNRTQFFGSFEYESVRASTEQHFASPSIQDRRFLGAPLFAVLNPTSGLSSFTTTLGATPLGRNIFSFYPLPNNDGGPYGDNTYTEIKPFDGDGVVASFKVTHQFNDNNTLNARYNFTDDERILPSVNRAINSAIGSDSRTQNLSLIFDSALSTNLFNQARFSFGRTRIVFPEQPGNPFVFQERPENSVVPVVVNQPGGGQQVMNFSSRTGPIGQVIIAPFSPVGVDVFTFPQGRVNNTFQFADTMSWTAGRHSVKFGADIRRFQLNSRQDRNYRPQVIFGTGAFATGFFDNVGNFIDFQGLTLLKGVDLAALGFPSSVLQTLTSGEPDSTIGLRFTEYNFFVNDNWRVRSNFTIDYGVRYENNTVPGEVNNRIEDALTLSNLPGQGRFQGNFNVFNDAVAGFRRVLGGRTEIYPSDGNNFGPHFGFAWDPFSDGKMAIRAGYGIYYDAILGAVVSQSRNIFPREITLNVETSIVDADVFNLFQNPSLLFVGGVPVIRPGTLNRIGGSPGDFTDIVGAFLLGRAGDGRKQSGIAFTLPAGDLRTPYTQQWHLTIERELSRDYIVSAAYVGTKGTKLTRLTTPNEGTTTIPFLRLTGQFGNFPTVVQSGAFLGVRPDPSLGAYQIFENSANSNYHALQLEAQKRYSSGYQFTVSYTLSHSLDDVSDVFPLAGAPVLAQDQNNLNLERGNSNFDVRNRFAASFIWDLPFYRGATDGAGRWLGGWQITSIFHAFSGQPFTLNVPFDNNLDGNLTDRPSTTTGLVFLDKHGPQRVQLPSSLSFLDFINVQVTPGNGLLPGTGFVGRNTARGDNFISWDMAFNKMFRFTESQNLEFRTEVFNLFNRANFGLPIRVIGAPGFGSAVDTVNPARVIQFALKYSF